MSEKIKCLECGREMNLLTKHITCHHKMSVDEYRKKHNYTDSLLADGFRKRRIEISSNIWKEKRIRIDHKFKCDYCGEDVIKNKKFFHYKSECKQTIKPLVKDYDYVECSICGEWGLDINLHMKKIHNLTKEELFERKKKGEKFVARILVDMIEKKRIEKHVLKNMVLIVV